MNNVAVKVNKVLRMKSILSRGGDGQFAVAPKVRSVAARYQWEG